MLQAIQTIPSSKKNYTTKHDFFTVCQSPDLACEVTLQPIEAFDLDAAIIFSDILVVPQIIGLEVQMIKGRGPVFPEPLQYPNDKDLDRINADVDVDSALGFEYFPDFLIALVRFVEQIRLQSLDQDSPRFGWSSASHWFCWWTMDNHGIQH